MIRDIGDLKILKKEDTFTFHCTCCGACCRHREDILLSAYDVVRLLKVLKMTFKEFAEKYCHLFIASNSKLPLVQLKPFGKNNVCPFLFHGKCSVHPVKPTVCALFPLGRIFNPETLEIKYFLHEVECGSKDRIHKVEDWLTNGSEESEECFKLWMQILSVLGSFIRANQSLCSNHIYNLFYAALYDSYDCEGNYQEQFKERLQKVTELVDMLNRKK